MSLLTDISIIAISITLEFNIKADTHTVPLLALPMMNDMSPARLRGRRLTLGTDTETNTERLLPRASKVRFQLHSFHSL